MILTCLIFLSRAILSIITIISLRHIQQICDYVYGTTDGVSEALAYQYCAILIIFLCIDAINSLIGLVQGSSSINKPKSIILLTNRNLTWERFNKTKILYYL